MTLLAACSCLLLPGSCKPEGLNTFFPADQGAADGQERWVDLPLTLAPADDGEPGTKASLLRDVEARGSGALVLVFRSDTRQLATSRFFRQDELDNQTLAPLSLRVPLAMCDFYILGNLNAMRKSDGVPVNLQDALGASFPMEETSLEALAYRLDGGDLVTGYRRETFTDVAACGIPYALIRKNINTASLAGAGQGIPDADRCCRLFSKVTVSIDHGAFDGGGANPEFFVNSHLYLRQANGRLQPFSNASQKAAEAADVLTQSDYDPDMSSTNASVTTFSFYVPENMQGTLLSGNADSRLKTRDELIARNLGGVEPYLTYVEFCGHLNPAAGGYGGDVTYRFYLGRDNCSNFDLERGREYKVSLSLRVGSIFDPDWRVTPDLTDSRRFALTADAAFLTDIGTVNDSRLVAVRKSRPGAFYLYMNPLGALGSTNLLLGKDASASTDFTPASLSDCSWYGAFLQAGTADANWLADHGISASWEKASGRLSFSVTDAAKFEARKADPARTFTLRLLPGGTVTADFRLALYDDLTVSVADGKSLTDEFYLGQKRTVTVSGFAGSTVKYAAVQPDCGGKSGNRMWKTSASDAAPFPGCARTAAGTPLLDVQDAAYAAQTYLGSLDVYAFYPNRFQPSHGWDSRSGEIVFFSEDWLNDSVEVPVRISEPYLKTAVSTDNLVLPIDGTPRTVTKFGYMDFGGNNFLDLASFDDTLYENYLAFTAAPTGGCGECIGVNYVTSNVYCRKTTYSGGGDLLTLNYNNRGVTTMTAAAAPTLYVNANSRTGLYSGHVFQQRCQFSKPLLGMISSQSGSGYVQPGTDAVLNIWGYFSSGNTHGKNLDVLNEDSKIHLYIQYNFVGSDLSTTQLAWEGAKTTYTSSHHETFGPVWDVETVQEDTGRGGVMSWTYDEAHQAKKDSYNEPVPGGLLIPYGPQTVRFEYSNRWETGRTMYESMEFKLHYEVEWVLFIGATVYYAAELHLVTPKHAKYLKAMAAQVNQAGRTFMTQFGGGNYWTSQFKISKAYGKANMGYSSAEYNVVYSPSVGNFPLRNFLTSYVTAGTPLWTQGILNKVLAGQSEPVDYTLFPRYLIVSDLPEVNTQSVSIFCSPGVKFGTLLGYWKGPSGAATRQYLQGVRVQVDENFTSY